MKGRSKCLSCGEALRASDLIPVVSYLLLKGKCRYCKSKYGVSAIIIEVLFGITFLALYTCILVDQPTLLLALMWLVYYTLLFGVLGVMALYDKAHSYIPLPFLAAFLALCVIMFGRRMFTDISLITILSPIFVALPFFLVWIISKGKGLGFGDVIIFFGVGAFFGSLQGFAVLMISVWMGAIYGLYFKYVLHNKREGVTPIPFVPFIVVAFLIVLFSGITIFFL